MWTVSRLLHPARYVTTSNIDNFAAPGDRVFVVLSTAQDDAAVRTSINTNNGWNNRALCGHKTKRAKVLVGATPVCTVAAMLPPLGVRAAGDERLHDEHIL